jgi:hypothetical protein
MENNGLKLEILKDESSKEKEPSAPSIYESPQVVFRLKVIDKTKRKSSCPMWPDNEEVEFAFDVDKDDPELIVKELKDKTNKIGDEDLRFLIQCIRDKCCLFRLEREDHMEEEGIINMNTSSSQHSSISVSQQQQQQTPSQHNNTSTHSNTLTNQSSTLNNTTTKASEITQHLHPGVIPEEATCKTTLTADQQQQQNNQQNKQHHEEQSSVDQAQSDFAR